MKSTRKELFRLQLISQNSNLAGGTGERELSTLVIGKIVCTHAISQVEKNQLRDHHECISNLRRHFVRTRPVITQFNARRVAK